MRRRALLLAAGLGLITVPAGLEPVDRLRRPEERPPAEPGEGEVLVQIDGVESPIDAGDEFSIEFTVTYTGQLPASVTLTLEVDGTSVATTTVDLEDASTVTSTISWPTQTTAGSPEGRSYEITLRSVDDSDAANVVVVTPRIDRGGIGFERVLDAVDDLGLDPEGRESIHRALERVPTGTLVRFPPGAYRFDSPALIHEAHLGIEAEDGDARFVVPAGYNNWLLDGRDIEAFYLGGIDVDQSASKTSPGFNLHGDRIHLEDVEFRGRADVWTSGAFDMLHCSISQPDGYGEIRGLTSREGHWARYGPSASGRIGIFTGRSHRGTLRIVDCDLREFGNNALYCSKTQPEGKVQVEDSYFENNNAAAIRIGGEGSYAENCAIVTDPSTYTGPRSYEDESFTHRGIVIEERFEAGDIQKPPGAEIRRCRIRIEDNPANGAAIHRYGNGRSLRIVDTVIEYNNNDYQAAVIATSNGFGKNPPADPPHDVAFIRSMVHGTGSVDAALLIQDADGSRIDDSIVYMHGAMQDGIHIERSNDCSIIDSTIDVPGEPTRVNHSEVTIENLDHQYTERQ